MRYDVKFTGTTYNLDTLAPPSAGPVLVPAEQVSVTGELDVVPTLPRGIPSDSDWNPVDVSLQLGKPYLPGQASWASNSHLFPQGEGGAELSIDTALMQYDAATRTLSVTPHYPPYGFGYFITDSDAAGNSESRIISRGEIVLHFDPGFGSVTGTLDFLGSPRAGPGEVSGSLSGTATGIGEPVPLPPSDAGLGQGLSQPDAQNIALLYAVALDRQFDIGGLDLDGFNWWIDRREQGASEIEVSRAFLSSPEFATRFGDPKLLGSQGLVDTLYDHGLHRAPDPAGEAYWVAALDSGQDPAVMLHDFSLSEEARADHPELAGIHEASPGLWGF